MIVSGTEGIVEEGSSVYSGAAVAVLLQFGEWELIVVQAPRIRHAHFF